jgi:hypothetical protein
VAFAENRFADAVDPLMRTRPHWQLLGGSHAQRDVWEQTAIHAAVGAGELGLASSLSGERITLRPLSPQSWYSFSTVNRKIGGPQGDARAMDAQNRAYMLGLGQGPGY